MNEVEAYRAMLADKVAESDMGHQYRVVAGQLQRRDGSMDFGSWEVAEVLPNYNWHIVQPPDKKPAPATLLECMEWAEGREGAMIQSYEGFIYLLDSSRTLFAQEHPNESVRVNLVDLRRTNYLVSEDGGDTWLSPNGEVDG